MTFSGTLHSSYSSYAELFLEIKVSLKSLESVNNGLADDVAIVTLLLLEALVLLGGWYVTV